MSCYLKLPGNVYSGENAMDEMVPIIKGRHKRVAVFTDQGVCNSSAFDLPLTVLKTAGVDIEIIDELTAEPTCDQAQSIIDRFRETNAGLIIAIGGGSIMDVAKLASVTASGRYGVRDLIAKPYLAQKKVETVMIPTTAGTGSEATPNSIVALPEKEVKVGIVSEAMVADYVVLDSAMTRTLPPAIAASTGIDALCHAVECFTSRKANDISDLFSLQSIKLIFASIERAYQDPVADEARRNMLLASFYGGAAIASSGTTAVHALSYPLGGKYHIPHGVANALLLMPVMRFNRDACVNEFAKMYDVLNPDPLLNIEEKADWVLDAIEMLIKRLELPASLASYGITRDSVDALVAAGMEQQRLLANNKRVITADDAQMLYEEILG